MLATLLVLLTGTQVALSTIEPNTTTAECKANPFDPTWPKISDWKALNESVGGCLIATSPAAASCWNNTGFHSPYTCASVQSNWTSSVFHSAQPESIGAPLFANNSCLPTGVDGYSQLQGCRLGGLPSYVLNATDEFQIAKAMRWAADRGVRIVVKGTGHDLNGRQVCLVPDILSRSRS